MTMLTERFPVAISFGATGGPEFSTDMVIVSGGAEYRNSNRQSALRRYDVSHAARKENLAKLLIKFFAAAAGRLNTFPFKDWSDYTAAGDEGGWFDLGGGAYQMGKQYTAGGLTHFRVIRLPVVDRITIYGNTGGTLDYVTGILTDGTGIPTSWVGEFDVLARFDTDMMELDIINKGHDGLLYGWNSIPIVEVDA